MLNIKGTNLRSRDDVICATMETGGTLTLQQNMNANSKNISSIGTVGATTGNITTVNATTVNATNTGGTTFTGTVNLGANQLNSSANIVTSGAVYSANTLSNGFFSQSTGTLHYQLIDTSMYMSKPINMNSQNISSIGTASGTTATFTNISAHTATGPITLATGQYMYGLDGAVDVLNVKGTNLRARNDQVVATMQNTGLQLECDLLANNKNILDGGRIEFSSLAGTDGTVIATSTSNFLTMSRAINMNSQNMDNVSMINSLSYKGCKKYQATGTSIVGSNNLSITVLYC